MGIHERTARRLLQTLEDEGYLQRGVGAYRQRYTYSVTPRLLALAGQLPLVTRAERAVRELHQSTGLDAYFIIPSYGDVIVLARAGDQAPAPWSLLPATESAGGSVLSDNSRASASSSPTTGAHASVADSSIAGVRRTTALRPSRGCASRVMCPARWRR